MWHIVRRLWPFPRSSEYQTVADDPNPSSDHWWWPGSWLRRKDVDSAPPAPEPAQPRLVVVHAGGAVLRAGASINSAKLGTLRRGEVVPVLKEEGRRACVKIPEGARAWISTVTPDGEAIVRRVTASTELKGRGMPPEGTSAFADAFEAQWQEKWSRLRVNADRKEERLNPVRSSTPGVPIMAWRPSSKYEEAAAKLKVKRPPKPSDAATPVPKLEQPASSKTSVVAPKTLLLAADEEDLPDLIGFDTWPQTSHSGLSGGSNVPSLADILSGSVPKDTTKLSSSARNANGEVVDDDDLGKSALVFMTEPTPSSSSRQRQFVAALPPRRTASFADGVTKAADAKTEPAEFEYLLSHIEEAGTPASEETASKIRERSGSPKGDATAEEVLDDLAVFAEPGTDEGSSSPESKVLAGFDFDPLSRNRPQRSSRKAQSKFAREVKKMPELLDVEKLDGSSLLASQEDAADPSGVDAATADTSQATSEHTAAGLTAETKYGLEKTDRGFKEQHQKDKAETDAVFAKQATLTSLEPFQTLVQEEIASASSQMASTQDKASDKALQEDLLDSCASSSTTQELASSARMQVDLLDDLPDTAGDKDTDGNPPDAKEPVEQTEGEPDSIKAQGAPFGGDSVQDVPDLSMNPFFDVSTTTMTAATPSGIGKDGDETHNSAIDAAVFRSGQGTITSEEPFSDLV